MLAAIAIDPSTFQYIDESLREDIEVAINAVAKNPFILRYAARNLWTNLDLLKLAFGDYTKASTDSIQFEEFLDKLLDHKIDEMAQGEEKNVGINHVHVYCLNLIEYLTNDDQKARRMFYTIAFQAEPINLVLNQLKNDDDSWDTSHCYFRDEDGNTDIHDNGRIDELLEDLDFAEEDEN